MACPRDGTMVRRPDDGPGATMLEDDEPEAEEGALEPTLIRKRAALGPGATMDDVVYGDRTQKWDPLLGARLGEYVVEERIGTGGMGIVYRGRQPEIGKAVAIKVLRPEIADDPEQVKRLLAEARAVNAIGHRGIIDIFSFGRLPDGRQYFVMELLNGVALDEEMARRGALPADEVLALLEDMLPALGAAHAAGVIHRDLKPSNLFLVSPPGGTPYLKLLDFGLARQSAIPGGRTPQTRNVAVGTAEYMAPEQARGWDVGPFTDLYSVGVLAYEMVTGRLPFTGASPVETIIAHLEKTPERPSALVPGLLPELEELILHLLAKEPGDRPQTADAVRREVRRVTHS
ncbi:MAG: serine/threonine-protein kinase, partial [Myxococcaceae bacterium]